MGQKQSKSALLQVLLGTPEGLIVCDSETRREEAQSSKFVTMVAVSASALFVAVLSEDQRLVIWTSDFTRRVHTAELEEAELPMQMLWCASDAVALSWQVKFLNSFKHTVLRSQWSNVVS